MLSSDLSFLIEFQTLLHLLSLTHSYLSSLFSLSSFTDVLTQVFSSDASTTGMNKFCRWLQRETIHLVCEGVFEKEVGMIKSDHSKRFILPKGEAVPPKHPALFLYGGKKMRQLLLQKEFQGFVGIPHLQTLHSISEMLHVQWLPGLIHKLEDQLDITVGGLRRNIEEVKEVRMESIEELAVLFKRMSERMQLSEDVMHESVWECVTFSNIYAFLRMCEKCVWIGPSDEIGDLISRMNDSVPDGNHYQSLLQHLPPQSSHAVTLTLPIFGRIAQMLAWDDSVCNQLPLFADSFLLSLFTQSFLQETYQIQSVLQSVIQCLSFLLTVTGNKGRLLDNGECMRVRFDVKNER